MIARDGEPKRQGASLAALIGRIPGTVAILVDTPRSNHESPHALPVTEPPSRRARHRGRRPWAGAIGSAKSRPGGSPHVPLIDLSKAICPTDPCPPIIGKRLVYRDHHHLTATFAPSLARDLDAAIGKIMPG